MRTALFRRQSIRHHPSQQHEPGTRLGAFCIALALCVLLALSGPHLVHHLFEMPAPDDHHGQHNDRPPQPGCLVLALWQHTPVMPACALSGYVPCLHTVFLALLPIPYQSNIAACVLHARAPPQHLHATHIPR